MTVTQYPKAIPFSQTPVSVLVANEHLERLDCVEFINSALSFHSDRSSVSPGVLAKAVILSTFHEMRSPLYKVASRFQNSDTEFLFGSGVTANHLNDDAIATCLDKIYEAGPDKLFSGFALSAYTKYDLDFSRLHSDTSNIVMYGDYEMCEGKNYEGVSITHGHSKANRPDKKQVGVGTIVNSQGVPLVSQTLDGNMADCQWNQEAIGVLQEVLGEKLATAVYIADCKLITMPNIHLLCDAQTPVQFISRCPDSFYGKLNDQLVQRAYREGNWSEPVAIGEKDTYTRYRTQSFIQTVEKHRLRFVVVETTSRKQAIDTTLERERIEFEQAVKTLLKQDFACQKDAEKALESFCYKNKKKLWVLNGAVNRKIHVTYKRGRRPADQPAQVASTTTTWHIRNDGITQHAENVAKKKQQLMTFVLVTNVTEDKLKDQEVLFTYKGQSVVEVQFHLLKTPCLASQVFLKKPELIEALMMLLQLSLLIRALLQYHARQRIKQLPEIPRIGLNRQKYNRPTASNILALLQGYVILFDGKNRYHLYYDRFQEERLMTLLYLLEIEERVLFGK